MISSGEMQFNWFGDYQVHSDGPGTSKDSVLTHVLDYSLNLKQVNNNMFDDFPGALGLLNSRPVFIRWPRCRRGTRSLGTIRFATRLRVDSDA